MAKCVFFNLPGASGHINPTLGVAKGLVDAGEEVIYYAGEGDRSKVSRTGAEFRSYAPWFEYNHSRQAPNNILDMALQLIDMTLVGIEPLLQRTAEDKPDYVIYDACCVWGKYISESLKLPTIASITHLVSSPWIMLSDGPLAWDVSKTLVRGLPLIIWARRIGKELMAKIGSEYRGIFYHIFDFFACVGELNIVFNTREFQPFASRLQGDFRYVGAAIAEGRDDRGFDLSPYAGKPLVYVSLGTVVENQDLDFFRLVMAALAMQDVNVIMSVGRSTDIEQLRPIPKNFTVKGFVPQLEILRAADLFITHGGMNSLNEALYFGVPVIVCPQQVEQAFNMRRLRKLGVAQPMPQRVSALTLRETVWTVLNDPTYRRNAEEYGRLVRAGGGHEAAVAAILDFVGHRRPVTQRLRQAM